MKTILFATDGSDSAGEALEFAIELAKETGAEIEVLAVKPPPVLSKGGVGLPILQVEEDQGAEHVASAAAVKAEGSGVHARAHVEFGEPAEAIAAAGERLEADLIVVGSRGLGAIRGAMLGSVSHELVKRSRIPVTIVRDKVHQPAHV
jgi:nucleotide-binding universal stress UspA family protein